MVFEFSPAVKRGLKARIGLAGPSGSGKTLSALRIARGLVGEDGRIAVIDTEQRSAELYSDIVTFHNGIIGPPYHPDRFVEAIDAAEKGGYDCLILDSLYHVWKGEGGVLEIVDAAKGRFGGNSHMAWSEGTPLWNRLVNRLLTFDGHVIVTMRSKQEYAQEKDDRGRVQVVKLGMDPEVRSGIEYEFTVFGDIDASHTLTVSKSRVDGLSGVYCAKPDEEFGGRIAAWLDGATAEETLPQSVRDAIEAAVAAGHPKPRDEMVEYALIETSKAIALREKLLAFVEGAQANTSNSGDVTPDTATDTPAQTPQPQAPAAGPTPDRGALLREFEAALRALEATDVEVDADRYRARFAEGPAQAQAAIAELRNRVVEQQPSAKSDTPARPSGNSADAWRSYLTGLGADPATVDGKKVAELKVLAPTYEGDAESGDRQLAESLA